MPKKKKSFPKQDISHIVIHSCTQKLGVPHLINIIVVTLARFTYDLGSVLIISRSTCGGSIILQTEVKRNLGPSSTKRSATFQEGKKEANCQTFQLFFFFFFLPGQQYNFAKTSMWWCLCWGGEGGTEGRKGRRQIKQNIRNCKRKINNSHNLSELLRADY